VAVKKFCLAVFFVIIVRIWYFEFGIKFSIMAVTLNFGIILTVMNDFVIDGVVGNLAFFGRLKYAACGIFSQIELATGCIGGIRRWIKRREDTFSTLNLK